MEGSLLGQNGLPLVIRVLPHGQVRRKTVVRSAELTHVPGLETFLGLLLGLDTVALAVLPPVAVGAHDDHLPVLVPLLTQRTLLEAVTRTTRGVVLVPAAVGPRGVGPAVLTHAAPFTLPRPVWYVVQGRVCAVDVVRDVAVIAQNQIGLVMLLSTSFTHCAVQTSPALLEDDLGDLDIDTMRVVTLATLGTTDQPPLQIIAQRATHYTNVLFQHKLILKRTYDHFAFLLGFIFFQ